MPSLQSLSEWTPHDCSGEQSGQVLATDARPSEASAPFTDALPRDGRPERWRSAVAPRVGDIAAGHGSLSRVSGAGQHLRGALVGVALILTVTANAAAAATPSAQRARYDRIASSLVAAQREGHMLIAGAGPDASGTEVIRVVDLTAAKKAYLRQRFGSDIDVQAASRADIPVLRASRIADHAPWNGGDFISDGSGTCTSGLPTHNGAGQQFLVTAGHCFAAGATVWNYAPDIGLGAATPSTRIGTVYSRDYRDGYLDAELISAAASSLTWVGATATTTSRSFAGGAGPVAAGSNVCVSGAFEGEHCDLIVQPNHVDQSQLFWEPATQTYHLSRHVTQAIGPNPQSVGEGDSGGPVYQYFGSTPKAVGIIAGGPDSVQCSNWGAQKPRKCSGTVWFTDVANILVQWGLTING